MKSQPLNALNESTAVQMPVFQRGPAKVALTAAWLESRKCRLSAKIAEAIWKTFYGLRDFSMRIMPWRLTRI